MYQRGKPFVGAKVIIGPIDPSTKPPRYYIVTEVEENEYVWWGSMTKNTYRSGNKTFLQEGEEPFYKTTDYIKALKKCLQ